MIYSRDVNLSSYFRDISKLITPVLIKCIADLSVYMKLKTISKAFTCQVCMAYDSRLTNYLFRFGNFLRSGRHLLV